MVARTHSSVRRGLTAKAQFESRAADWERQGRRDALLLEGWRLMALRCWSWSAGGEREGMSEVLRAFMTASESRQDEDWLDDLLDDRDSCRGCGRGFRVENLMACTSCLDTYCHACGARATKAAART
jgi:hypothetical protein